jgi:hypothetical protein
MWRATALVLAVLMLSAAAAAEKGKIGEGEPEPTGVWKHFVSGRYLGDHEFVPGGGIETDDSPNRWAFEDGVLTLRFPSRQAPGGVWIDTLKLSADGNRYEGKNQAGTPIRGERIVNPEPLSRYGALSRDYPLSMLPAFVTAEAGLLTLHADFVDIRDGGIVAYLVNRTGRNLPIQSEAGDMYLKLEARSPSGAWERATGHVFTGCGNAFSHGTLRQDRFLKVLAPWSRTGEERPVRLRMYCWLTEHEVRAPIVSNVGRGRVEPQAIEACRYDRISVARGGFELLARVAKGEAPRPKDEWMDLREIAAKRLREFPSEESVEILRALLSCEKAGVRQNAIFSLEAIGAPARKAIPDLERLAKDDPNKRIRAWAGRAAEYLASVK